ncbi:MAG TPA: hypothetical protein VG737_10475 [Cyclobacteriaceae bacterium]|nr:hypothetical protein [Cyclobacteriaceae bacterium]
MKLFERFFTISKWFYLVILGLAIPYYLLLFGASGHQISIQLGDFLWMMIVILAFVAYTLYLRIEEKTGLEFDLMRAFVMITLILTVYGAFRIFLFMVQFDFGDDVSLVAIGLSYFVPVFFIFSGIVISIDLYGSAMMQWIWLYYGGGFLAALACGLIFGFTDSHTPPLAFVLEVLIIPVGVIWMLTEILILARRKQNLSSRAGLHVIGLWRIHFWCYLY